VAFSDVVHDPFRSVRTSVSRWVRRAGMYSRLSIMEGAWCNDVCNRLCVRIVAVSLFVFSSCAVNDYRGDDDDDDDGEGEEEEECCMDGGEVGGGAAG